MESKPKISVLIPVYNTREEHLQEALDSILAQTFSDFELIVVNDASTDPNVERAVLSRRDSRIRYFTNQNNLGISATRNRLLDLARGEYLAVMDHDDISLPRRFEKQAEYLDKHPEVGVVSSSAEFFGEENCTVRHPEDDREIRLALVNEYALFHSGSMIRKSVLTGSGVRYEEEFSPAEDYRLWCRLIPHTRFHNIPEPLFRYRMHAENETSKQKRKMLRAASAVRSRVKAECPALYAEYMEEAAHITKVKLFGCIPCLKIIAQGRRRSCFLFGIPLYRAKIDHRLPHKG